MTEKPVARTPVANQAAQVIRDMIIAGELRPGQALPPERRLAELLEISRPTLRQAISALAAMNIVESRHGGGTYVTELTPSLLAQPLDFLLHIDPQSISHLFEVRRALEVTAAELAAIRISAQTLVMLREIVEAGEEALDDIDAFIEQDRLLHFTIVSSLSNPIFDSLISSLEKLSNESRRRTAIDRRVREQTHRDHKAIVDALAARDTAAAGGAMRAHLLAVEASGLGRSESHQPEVEG
jgi:GntR family transcriptional repressor for pyruvate dehydrogenase complex